MATRAVYSFRGFPGAPIRHLYLHHDGYPTGAAWRFAMARRHNPSSAGFLNAFLETQPRAEPLATPDQSADAEYRYGLELLAGDDSHLQVQYWRRMPGGTSWQPRCGPITLEKFIQRFLPGEPLESAQ
ncbi:hypothetical protein KQ302_11070 [Synechococcus sp. CS-602]|uniref:hypothetical protein n=1 Tax=Synechococcaceae TaxID=1890426 RepID=UPI0008FF45CA|nr:MULTISPECIES: hypothetical protein [Synechococcaceae]MCT4363995.1 hypothetical protein [Candidatus Regnicoccus frigidus MAG-AL1]APD47183.1 hypothetical protein BM449_01190 [Synechococcus sp. SynAce01]MCT0201248.1 hypothetical protein [Synechococcus sp. CS-603]MCT0205632.1 hypothetical protein [Synechococcus sp. CS-602]MCT0245564.1 hypothetical protein [Synechococcus sp. CS-601]